MSDAAFVGLFALLILAIAVSLLVRSRKDIETRRRLEELDAEWRRKDWVARVDARNAALAKVARDARARRKSL